MKKLLLILLFAGLVGGFGFICYQVYVQLSAQELNKPMQVSNSTSGGGTVVKEVKNRADVMESISQGYEKNPDTVAWLQLPNTSINNPVLQSFNNAYYLRINEQKKPDIYGSYFVDYACSVGARDVISQNTIIYGHSDLKDNPNGPRFSQLFNWTQSEFAQKNPYIYLSTSDEELVYEIFAVFYTDTKMNYIQPSYSDKKFTELIQEAQKKSLFKYEDVEVGKGDKILTLSTCSVKYGDRNDIRFVMMGRLVPKGTELKTEATLSLNVPVEPN